MRGRCSVGLGMDPLNLDVFQVAERRLAWLDRRQAVLAQNVANVSTPGYRPRDVAPFAASGTSFGAALAQTAAAHLPGRAQAGGAVRMASRDGQAPDGNGVSVERQMGAIADTATMQELALNLDRAYQSMIRTSFGRGG